MPSCFSARFISPFSHRIQLNKHILEYASLRRGLILLAALCVSGAAAFGQARATAANRDWTLFGGMSYLHPVNNNTLPDNFYGWNAAVSQSPYPAAPWLGGVIEASGRYVSTTQRGGGIGIGPNAAFSAQGDVHGAYEIFNVDTDRAIYSVMGGPLFSVRTGGFRPFVRALVGVNIARTTETIAGASTTDSTTAAAFELGGGADVSLSPMMAVRTQVGWGRNFRNSSSADAGSLRAATGLVFRF
jgi:hypothetical protein